MKNPTLHRLYGRSRFLRRVAMGLLARAELLSVAGHKPRGVLDLIRQTRRGRESLMGGREAFVVHAVARAQSALPGVMAEVGVYEGCSAKLISIASGGCPLHLFDTFDGLPEPGAGERPYLRRRQYRSSLDAVRRFMADTPNVTLHPGCFPATASGLEDVRFSFVHLDVDLKSSTVACLEFFYPRMVPGGIIMTHDYSLLDGVRDAFDSFVARNPGQLIELPTSQALLVCGVGAAQAAVPARHEALGDAQAAYSL